MNTRSRAKADQKVRRSIEKQRRIERKKRFATRDNVVTPYRLRSTMGRKGGNSTKATHSRSKQNVESFEKGEVAPIRLFSLGEEDTSAENEEIQICSGQNAATNASTSEHIGQKVMNQTQRSTEDVDGDEDSLGRGEVNMETDGKYSTEEVNSYTETGC
jgi:hypothetical protein